MTPGGPLDPYAPPRAVEAPDRGALDGEELTWWRARVRRGATLLFASELGRAVLWRVWIAWSMYYSMSADPAEHLEGGAVATMRATGLSLALLIKLVGAFGVTAGVWMATARPPRPLGGQTVLHPFARALAALELAGHGWRWVLHLGSSNAPASLEPATNLLDALVIAASACALAPVFRAGGRPGGAGAVGFGFGYLVLVAGRVYFWGKGGHAEQLAWSTAMLALGVYAAWLVWRLRRLLVP